MQESDPVSSRRRAREVALQVLYAIDLGSRHSPPGDPVIPGASGGEADGEAGEQSGRSPSSPIFDAVAANFETPEGSRSFARELVEQVQGNLVQIDQSISHHSANWRIERMAAVDRNILRLGTYELVHTTPPVGVILNEAVDLARRFGNDPSPSFVNGILDAVARGVRECEP